jgi:hypothetical protein
MTVGVLECAGQMFGLRVSRPSKRPASPPPSPAETDWLCCAGTRTGSPRMEGCNSIPQRDCGRISRPSLNLRMKALLSFRARPGQRTGVTLVHRIGGRKIYIIASVCVDAFFGTKPLVASVTQDFEEVTSPADSADKSAASRSSPRSSPGAARGQFPSPDDESIPDKDDHREVRATTSVRSKSRPAAYAEARIQWPI